MRSCDIIRLCIHNGVSMYDASTHVLSCKVGEGIHNHYCDHFMSNNSLVKVYCFHSNWTVKSVYTLGETRRTFIADNRSHFAAEKISS